MRLEKTVRGGFKAASEARRSLSELSHHVPADVLDNIVLMVNELVTNAVRHGMVGASGEIVITVDASDSLVRVEVVDTGKGAQVAPRPPSIDEGSGWGLHIVERLSDRWGFEQNATTCVWFEMDIGRR